jgi:protein phosphatase
MMNLSVKDLVEEPETISKLTSTDIKELILKVENIVRGDDSLLKVSKGNVLVVGDTHGDFRAAQYIVNLWKEQDIETLVFLGDYVDRGDNQLENINYLLALKVLYPGRVFLLRGNHETPSVNSYYGFSSVCINTFGEEARGIYNRYNILFSYFSPALLVLKKILLLHGGIPAGLHTLEDINSIPKGDLDVKNDILGQILWNDPSEYHRGFEPNWERGIHLTYGKNVFSEFLETHDLDMVIRAHEVFLEGYKYFFDNKLLSIFSSPNYRMGNRAKVAEISGKGDVSLIDVKEP